MARSRRVKEERETSSRNASNNDQQNDEQERPKLRRSKRKIGTESAQSETDRRRLRRNQRNLYEQIQLGGAENDENNEINNSDDDNNKNNSLKALNDLRTKNNELFEKVAYTREAVLDGDNMDEIARKLTIKVEQLIKVPRYDPLRLVSKLKQKCNSNTGESLSSYNFDWKTLGIETGVCFNAIPSRVHFLAGPLDNDVDGRMKKRKKPIRRQKMKIAEEEKPEDVKNIDKTADQLSAVELLLKTLKKGLKERCNESSKHNVKLLNDYIEKNDDHIDEETKQDILLQFQRYGQDIDAIKFLFNPKSFTQTVENIFSFSFMIKKGEARIMVRDQMDGNDDEGEDEKEDHHQQEELKDLTYNGEKSGGMFIRSVGDTRDAPPTPRQSVVAFTMNDWRKLCEAYEVTESDVPHRTGSKHQSQQSSSSDE